MGLFSKDTKKNFVGIDLGASGVKLVELVNEKNKARLMTYGYANLPSDGRGSLFDDADRAAALLKKVMEKARCTTKKSIAALPISSIFSSIVSVQKGTIKEMEAAAQAQAQKLLPMPVEDVVMDFKIIDGGEMGKGEGKNKKEWARVLVTAAPKTLVSQYTTIFQKAGLELIALETEVFAHIRSLIGKDRSTIMVIDSGIERTNFTIVDKGVPFLTRSIASGGHGITERISNALGVPQSQAETMKRDIRSLQNIAGGDDVTEILEMLVKPILDEVTYTFQMWKDQSQQSKNSGRIGKIILTGGGMLLPGLTEFFTKKTNVNAYLGDPWARVVTPPQMRPVLDEIGSRFSVSLGCAMREIE